MCNNRDYKTDFVTEIYPENISSQEILNKATPGKCKLRPVPDNQNVTSFHFEWESNPNMLELCLFFRRVYFIVYEMRDLT